MGNILQSYPSKSKPGKLYNIVEPMSGGEPYCDCWQWKMNKECSHLRQYHAELGLGLVIAPPVPVKKELDDVGLVMERVLSGK